MNIDKLIKGFGDIDSEFIDEAVDYSPAKTRGDIVMIKKIAAIAVCAVFVIGAAVVGVKRQPKLPAEPPVGEPTVTEPTAVPDVIDPDDLNIGDVVQVEHSYNDMIANGEDVNVETYIGQEFNACGYTFVLRNVNISPTLPAGITVDELRFSVSGVGDYDEDGFHVLHPNGDIYEIIDIRDCLDSAGRYSGPTKEGYRWVFVTVDITNLSNEEKVEYSNIDLCGGEHITSRWSNVYDPDDTDSILETVLQEVDYYEYMQSACYMSEHTDKECYDGQAEIKKFDNIHFDPNQTKTLVIGYLITDHYVYDDLYLYIRFLNNWFEDKQYIPLK